MREHTTFRGGLRILAQALLAALTVCAPVVPAGAAVGEANVPLPAYRPGTTFVYADGSWETIVSATADEVLWRDHLGFLSGGSPDFTRRRARWESATRRGTRVFGPREDLFVRGETTVWPLAQGRTADFKESGTWAESQGPEEAYAAYWSCKVDGQRTVSVPAGSFDTWKIDCSRFSLVGDRNVSRLWEDLTWYYAPEVGHYVLAVSKHVDELEPRRRELLAVMPPAGDWPADAQSRMEESLQQALESHPSGRPRSWSSPGAKVSGEAVPSGTFRAGDGTFCRQYVQRIDTPEERRNYYGMACRTPGGRWEVRRE